MDCGALVAQRDHQLQDRPTAYTHYDALDFPDEKIVATSCLTKIRPISNSSCGTSDIARGCTLIFDFLYSGPNFGALASVAALRHLVCIPQPHTPRCDLPRATCWQKISCRSTMAFIRTTLTPMRYGPIRQACDSMFEARLLHAADANSTTLCARLAKP